MFHSDGRTILNRSIISSNLFCLNEAVRASILPISKSSINTLYCQDKSRADFPCWQASSDAKLPWSPELFSATIVIPQQLYHHFPFQLNSPFLDIPSVAAKLGTQDFQWIRSSLDMLDRPSRTKAFPRKTSKITLIHYRLCP